MHVHVDMDMEHGEAHAHAELYAHTRLESKGERIAKRDGGDRGNWRMRRNGRGGGELQLEYHASITPKARIGGFSEV